MGNPFADSAARTAKRARENAARKNPKGQRTARGVKNFSTGRPAPTRQANDAAEKLIRRLSGKPGGATVTRNRAAEAYTKRTTSSSRTTSSRKTSGRKTSGRTTRQKINTAKKRGQTGRVKRLKRSIGR